MFLFCSCQRSTDQIPQNDSADKPIVNKNTAKEVLVAPQVTVLTALNPPRVVNAGKPFVRVDSSNGSTPFFANYGTEQGMAQSSALCGMSDKEGNLWFGTAGRGVCRYDGKNFTNYTIAQGLASNVVLAVLEDKEGNIWMGTTAGASKYDGYHFSTYTIEDGLAGNFVSCMRQDSKGNLWFGTHEGGISKFDGKRFTNYAKAQGLAGNYVHCIMEDRNRNMWFGTDAGVSRYDGFRFGNVSKMQGLVDNSVNSIVQDDTGNLWFGTTGGISKFNGRNFTNYTTADGLPDNNVSCILQERTGELWIATHTKGISKFDGARFTNYSKAQGLSEDHVTGILEDAEGQLWFTTLGGGVCRYGGNSLTNCTISQNSSSHLVFSIMEDKSNNLWFGTYDEGVYEYDGKRFTNYSKVQGLPDNLIWGMLADRSGNIWFGTDRGGVSKFDGRSFTNYAPAQGLAGNTVNCIVQDKNGDLWFGTRGGGASRFDGHRFINYTTRQGLAGNTVQCILEDKAGNIWFGTHDDGVSKYDGERFSTYTKAQGLVSNTVYNIIQDKKGAIWFGTNRGASKYDGKRFTSYTTGQKLADDYIWGIAEDTANSMIWFGTNFGLSGLRQPPDADTSSRENEFEIFNENTGYRIKELNSGALYMDHKGTVWLGTAHAGLMRFDYKAVNKNNRRPPNLKIQAIKVNNENICWSNLPGLRRRKEEADNGMIRNEMMTTFGRLLAPSELDSINKKYQDIRLDGMTPFYPVPTHLVLPHHCNQVTIDFGAIDPSLERQVKYQYKLEGYANDWSSPGNNTTAVFGNIPAGSYLFKLRAMSAFGVTSEIEYRFNVLPPWWATWWAYAVYAILAGGMLYALYRNRIRQIERKEAARINIMVAAQEDERRRISRDLHDDVGMKLSALKLMLSSLHEKSLAAKNEDIAGLAAKNEEIDGLAAKNEEIGALAKSAENLLSETVQDVRQLLHNLSPGILEEFGYITAVEGLVDKINQSDRTRFTLVTFGMKERLRKDYELALYRITQELINNTLKHADAKKISLQIGRRDGKIILMIEDDGKGFDTTTQKDGYGLHNLDIRTTLMKGTMTIDSRPGKGTSVLIEIPYNLSEI
jgi:ligand-binding sensor domain-containing protein/signal transduction histidine kinase